MFDRHRFLFAAGAVGAALVFSMTTEVSVAQVATSRAAASAPLPDARLIERLSERQHKVLALRCAHESGKRAFAQGEAAFCSLAWELLRQRSFAGDSDALLAWWRAHRDDALVESGDEMVVHSE